MVKGIVFFDIDGTLVDSGNHKSMPSEKTLHAIQKLKENGYKCFIASGRNYAELHEYFNIGMDGFVYSDGAGIKMGDEPHITYPIEQEAMNRFMDLVINQLGASAKMAMKDGSFNTQDQYDFFQKLIRKRSPMHYEEILKQMNFILIDEYVNQEILQIDVFFKSHEDEQYWLTQSEGFHYISTPMPYSEDGVVRGEITRTGITKGFGCQEVERLYGVDMKDTYAFGDSMNDEEMFKVCGNTIAMGNGDEKLKQIASMVTDTVDRDGIVQALQKLNMI